MKELEFRNIGVFDADNDPIHVGFESVSAAAEFVKENWSESEWVESGFSLCSVIEDEKGCVLMFADEFNPFEYV